MVWSGVVWLAELGGDYAGSSASLTSFGLVRHLIAGPAEDGDEQSRFTEPDRNQHLDDLRSIERRERERDGSDPHSVLSWRE